MVWDPRLWLSPLGWADDDGDDDDGNDDYGNDGINSDTSDKKG